MSSLNYLKYKFIIFFLILNDNYKEVFIINDFYTGYYKIHPIIFYISITYIYIYNFNKLLTKINYLTIINITIISFILGSFWALYQLIWGFYWSSDYIEIILIYNLLVFLYLYHKIRTKTKNYNIHIINSIIILIFLRLNLIYTKHSFFNKSKQTIYFFEFYIFLCFYNIIFNIKNYIFNIKYKQKIIIILIYLIILNKFNLKNLQIFIYICIINIYIFIFSKILLIQKKKKIHLFIFICLFLFINLINKFFICFIVKTTIYLLPNLNYNNNFINKNINILKNKYYFFNYKYNIKLNYFEIKNVNLLNYFKNKTSFLINYI